MNVERLHRIIIDLADDLKDYKILSLVQNVQNDLQNQVNAPSEPTYQTSLVANLEILYKALENSEYNDYSPSWKEIINDISGENLFGVKLKERLQLIFAQNTITPAKALEDLKEIHNALETFQTALKNLISSFEILNIEEEELEPGQCELGYTIPRLFVHNKLSSLKKEIIELNFILNSISEAVTGEKQEYDVKTISSSDFLLYIIIGLGVADVLSKATERILNHYKQILEIKHLRNQLKEKGIPASKTKSIETHANSMMEDEIKRIAKEVINEYYVGKDNGRKNELENSVIISLNKLANRIDNGFNIEIRVEPLPSPKEDEIVSADLQKKRDLVKSIQTSSKNIEYIETNGQSILELPE
ncbi:hypothetical protein ACHRVK_11520 [Flavobacterium plurextorum]|uniref:hypothetical protein n=1 Tax=Flavobacterium plurextorum TaxID=1114867 RepID=UPI00375762C9